MFSALRMYLGASPCSPSFCIMTTKIDDSFLPVLCPKQIPWWKVIRRIFRNNGGILCGIIIFFAANFQQVGLVSVSAGKTAFITAPVYPPGACNWSFPQTKLNRNIWLGVIWEPWVSIFMHHRGLYRRLRGFNRSDRRPLLGFPYSVCRSLCSPDSWFPN